MDVAMALTGLARLRLSDDGLLSAARARVQERGRCRASRPRTGPAECLDDRHPDATPRLVHGGSGARSPIAQILVGRMRVSSSEHRGAAFTPAFSSPWVTSLSSPTSGPPGGIASFAVEECMAVRRPDLDSPLPRPRRPCGTGPSASLSRASWSMACFPAACAWPPEGSVHVPSDALGCE